MKKGMIIAIVGVSILVAWIGWLAGFPFPRTDIDQTVTIDDVCLDTYRVSTELWINRYGDVILDTWYRESEIKCSEIQQVKKIHMEAAEKKRKVVEKCLKDFKYCDEG